ncbi:cytochrome c biogenesis protein CcdA [Natronobeatus ordinarius]|uniref:cytochrome c biogenesis protein CcdA n=1 Tax=Natronobeatus ordinarius TaxID=2963433 RepID=UPI0020CFCC99|nr:cytochrome c biogenesis protein CcdA [Natronobeatus ordinarius]
MLDAALATALAFALFAGLATFFSPCAFPLLPGYVAFYVSQTEGEEASLGGAISRGLVAGAGVLATFAVLMGLTFWIGHRVLEGVTAFEALVGLVLVVFGILVVADRIPSFSVALPKRRSSVLGFGIFGAGYALAAAGCAAPFFVGVVVNAVSLEPAGAALVIGTYAGAVTLLMVSVTVATGMGLLAGAGQLAPHMGTIKRIAGVVMILAGLGQLYLVVFDYSAFFVL